jgi:hypothetical protein
MNTSVDCKETAEIKPHCVIEDRRSIRQRIVTMVINAAVIGRMVMVMVRVMVDLTGDITLAEQLNSVTHDTFMLMSSNASSATDFFVWVAVAYN